MPVLTINLTDSTYNFVVTEADKQEKPNRSAVVEALLASAALLTADSKRFIKEYAFKEGVTERDALNDLIKHGSNYWYVVKPDLLQKVE